ncbi:hypothetical protein QS257_16775 [Terrilactibacillus sp. S3-3]|nr:hypothetical protein QS257_16775 [Terrilactibacillus sp. S3-3]
MQEHYTESHYVLHDKLKQYYVQVVDTQIQTRLYAKFHLRSF